MMTPSIFQPGVEVRELHSHIMNQDMQVFVKLPWRYEQSSSTYPVLYSLDANRAFPLYSTMSLVCETPGISTEEIVIVGIGYRLDSSRIRGLAQWATWRTRDLTPARREAVEQYWVELLSALLDGEALEVQTGGAPLFLQSLREEIIPFIEANYRVSPKDRGLAGYSYGGLFALYVLFHAPEMFTRYFAGSPTMWPQLFEYEEEYASTHEDLKARLFVTAGGRESDLLEPVQRLVGRLRARRYSGLEVLSTVFEGEAHTTCMAAAVSRALCVLYYESLLADTGV